MSFRRERKKWIKARFAKIEKITELTWKFTIELDQNFEYVAGQFANLKVNGVVRSYSIASYNSNENTFELLIVKLEGGELTTILFNETKEGDELEVKGPYGHFVLPEKIENDLFFICTGTGLAPFRSMLDYIQKFNINHERIYLIFGTRKKDDIICYEEILSIQKNMDNLDYIPVLSREEWAGATGYVHTHYKTLVETKDLKDPIFYLCGWRGMILEARDNLKEYGYDSEKIICEIYD